MYMFIIAAIIFTLIVRIFCMLPSNKSQNNASKLKLKERLSTVIVIGSGGHTAEMLQIASRLNKANYSPRYYILASSDTTSATQVMKVEKERDATDFTLLKIPRSRHVGQSYISSVFTTMFSALYCIPLLLRYHPQLVVCNGPGTCVPICLILFMMKVLFISDSKIIFIESICRVKTLSLTGHILYYIADLFFVQWPGLCKKYQKCLYVGRL